MNHFRLQPFQLDLTRASRVRRGFTLFELLIALGMVVVFAASLYQSLRVAFNAKHSAEAAVIPSRTTELAMEFLRTDIECALVPTPNSLNYATTSTTTTTATSSTGVTPLSLAGSFVGSDSKDDRGHDADDLIFYTTSDGPEHPQGPDYANGDGEIKMVELTMFAVAGTNDHVLVRRVTRNLLNPQLQPPPRGQLTPDDEVICRHVAGFNLRYYDGSNWQDNWDSTQQNNELPTAVEVTLSLDPPDANTKTPPRLFVRVFPVILSTLVADNNTASTSGTTASTSGSTGTTGGTKK